MTRAVWKFMVQVEDTFTIEMPEGAHVLSVAVQHELVAMWALVDPGAKREQRTFHVYGTGHVHDSIDFGRFIGSFQLMGGAFVGHLFEGR